MNTSNTGSNSTFLAEIITQTGLTTTSASPKLPRSPPLSSDLQHPEFTIMVVLGLSLLLAGIAAGLAVRRRSEQEEDYEASCVPGERLTGGRSSSAEPQLKVWRRLGSYRRSYNLSFRRPPHRRPPTADRIPPLQPPASQAGGSVEPKLTAPCLFDYVTEI
ncbi:uncharacterized protein LOC144984153 [Oryzias latipes]